MLGNKPTENQDASSLMATKSQLADRMKIEDVVRRACEIHRQRGGWFGFDYEDWAQAWAEWPGGNVVSPNA